MNFEQIASLVGMITGVIGTVFGLISIAHNRFLAVNEFLSGLHDPGLIEARKHVYNTAPDALTITDEAAAEVINFFQRWGLLAQHKYLPLWVFDHGSGGGTIRLYKKLEPFIIQMRTKHSDATYASGFEWLYKALVKRGKPS